VSLGERALRRATTDAVVEGARRIDPCLLIFGGAGLVVVREGAAEQSAACRSIGTAASINPFRDIADHVEYSRVASFAAFQTHGSHGSFVAMRVATATRSVRDFPRPPLAARVVPFADKCEDKRVVAQGSSADAAAQTLSGPSAID